MAAQPLRPISCRVWGNYFFANLYRVDSTSPHVEKAAYLNLFLIACVTWS